MLHRQEHGYKKLPQGILKDENWGSRVESNSHFKAVPQSRVQQVCCSLKTGKLIIEPVLSVWQNQNGWRNDNPSAINAAW